LEAEIFFGCWNICWKLKFFLEAENFLEPSNVLRLLPACSGGCQGA
jgi:hypothetical protein